jgi:photosystem II stability/assembly factor-like uncharacterized protein
MINSQAGWAVTYGYDANVLLQTSDGGSDWKDVTPSSVQRIFGLYAPTALTAWVGPFRTVDGGGTWKQGAIPAHGGIRSIHFINARDGWLLALGEALMGSVEAFVYRSTDGGENWILVARADFHNGDSGSSGSRGLPLYGSKSDITFLSATTGWITGGHGIVPNWLYLYITRDAGRTWRQQKLPPPPQMTPRWFSWTYPPKFFTSRNGILPVFLSPEESSAPVIVFYVTHDGGGTWTPTRPVSVVKWSSAGWLVPYSFPDMDNGWVSDGDTLFATRDGGRQWTAIQPAQPFADVKQIDFVSPQIGFAVSKISPYLQKTLDGGRTWRAVNYTISRPEEVAEHCCSHLPPDAAGAFGCGERQQWDIRGDYVSQG